MVAGSLLHLNTSQGEGWGLGVPTVAYDVEGLRDAVRDGETGWLVREGEEFADVVERALKGRFWTSSSRPGRSCAGRPRRWKG